MENLTMNRIEIRGHIGQEPRINQSETGTMARFSVATSEIFKDRKGNLKEETTWHNIVAWEGTSVERIPALRKGMLVEITGKLRTNRYTNSMGEDRVIMEVIASRISPCDLNTGEVIKQ